MATNELKCLVIGDSLFRSRNGSLAVQLRKGGSMSKLKRKDYEKLLEPMQQELVGMARWAAATGQRVVVLFEGRDTAGKGGAIGAVADQLNPRQCRTIALAKPSEEERNQWYFQR